MKFALSTFATLLAMVDPIGVIAPYLAMSATCTDETRRGLAFRAVSISALVLILVAAGGGFVFQQLGITLHAFRIAGGILLFTAAMDMLRARLSETKATQEEETERIAENDIAVIPLAMPLIAGPGAVAAVLILSARAQTAVERVSVYGSILLTLTLVYLTLSGAHRIARVLRRTGMNVVTRLSGLLLAAMAAQFVIDGVRGALTGSVTVRSSSRV